MEYAGFRLVRGCGCRSGFCGACAVVYRIQGETKLYSALACQTKVEEGMCVGRLESFPINKKDYDINNLPLAGNVVGQFYPEIYNCIHCNACTKSCPQGINVMKYIALAQRGDYEGCAEESFRCVACDICASRCPVKISHSAVSLMVRRLTGRYIAKKAPTWINGCRILRLGCTMRNWNVLCICPIKKFTGCMKRGTWKGRRHHEIYRRNAGVAGLRRRYAERAPVCGAAPVYGSGKAGAAAELSSRLQP